MARLPGQDLQRGERRANDAEIISKLLEKAREELGRRADYVTLSDGRRVFIETVRLWRNQIRVKLSDGRWIIFSVRNHHATTK